MLYFYFEQIGPCVCVTQWGEVVRSVFEKYDYGACPGDESDDGLSTQQEVNDFEMTKIQESLSDIGKPDKVHLLYIFKQWSWTSFAQKFNAVLQVAQEEVRAEGLHGTPLAISRSPVTCLRTPPPRITSFWCTDCGCTRVAFTVPEHWAIRHYASKCTRGHCEPNATGPW